MVDKSCCFVLTMLANVLYKSLAGMNYGTRADRINTTFGTYCQRDELAKNACAN